MKSEFQDVLSKETEVSHKICFQREQKSVARYPSKELKVNLEMYVCFQRVEQKSFAR